MTMAQTTPTSAARPAKLVDHDTVHIEFIIDDLIQQLAQRRFAAASCNGCNHCGATIEQQVQTQGES
jgi:hypothetical protein